MSYNDVRQQIKSLCRRTMIFMKGAVIMKKVCKTVQGVSLIALVISVLAAALVPALYYVAGAAMLVLALSAIVEPEKAPGCPEIFTRQYQEQYYHKAA